MLILCSSPLIYLKTLSVSFRLQSYWLPFGLLGHVSFLPTKGSLTTKNSPKTKVPIPSSILCCPHYSFCSELKWHNFRDAIPYHSILGFCFSPIELNVCLSLVHPTLSIILPQPSSPFSVSLFPLLLPPLPLFLHAYLCFSPSEVQCKNCRCLAHSYTLHNASHVCSVGICYIMTTLSKLRLFSYMVATLLPHNSSSKLCYEASHFVKQHSDPIT
jgi:hypothetical protein